MVLCLTATPSIRNMVVDKERMSPVGELSLVGISVFTSVECFDTVCSVSDKAVEGIQPVKICVTYYRYTG